RGRRLDADRAARDDHGDRRGARALKCGADVSERTPDVRAHDERPPAGVLRRFGAMFYDLLIVIALLTVVTAAFLPLSGVEAVSVEGVGALEYVYRLVMLATSVLFFGLFWTRRGETLGMAAWRLRIERDDGGRVSWTQVLQHL